MVAKRRRRARTRGSILRNGLCYDPIVIRPSMLDGAASLFDFAGALTPRVRISPTGKRDAEAIAADWQNVGRDIWVAIGAVRPEVAPEDEA